MAEMFNIKLIKNPKKKYYCYNCNHIINGEHLYMVAVIDGQFFYGRWHYKCSGIQDKVCLINNKNELPIKCCSYINVCIKNLKERKGS